MGIGNAPSKRNAKRHVYLLRLGGTIGSRSDSRGVRNMDAAALDSTTRLLDRIPFTQVYPLQFDLTDDSSKYPKSSIIDLGRALLTLEGGDGVIIGHGTDTMERTAAMLALMGNERWRYPVTLLGSMKGPEVPGSDAPVNTITAGLFTAFGDASGVFAVRPHGVVITSRYDTPGGSANWHGRGNLYRAPRGYFARVDYQGASDVLLNLQLGARELPSMEKLERMIEYQRLIYEADVLDTPDQIVVGGRARMPNVSLLGYGEERIKRFKARPEGDTPEQARRDMNALIAEMQGIGQTVGKVIPGFALVEHVKRHRDDSTKLREFHTMWAQILYEFLCCDLKVDATAANGIVSFWGRNSNVPNDGMDFRGLKTVDTEDDPDQLYNEFQRMPPRGLVLQATGASGVRLEDVYGESHRRLLDACRDDGVPVVLIASQLGEVTSLEYPPAMELLENDYVFFAGTMDATLVRPRMALLNSRENRGFMNELLSLLPDGERNGVERSMYRQLLSGSHCRMAEGRSSDRQKIEERYGTETRVDLLGGMHAKKAIYAAWHYEVHRRGLELPASLHQVLSRY